MPQPSPVNLDHGYRRKAVIKVNCDGTTEIGGGKTRKLNFEFRVDDEVIPTLLADALKVRFRSKFRNQVKSMNDGDDVLITVRMNGSKVELSIVDERAARRAEIEEYNRPIVAKMTSGQCSAEELLELAKTLKSIE